jgi:hypothetical protein
MPEDRYGVKDFFPRIEIFWNCDDSFAAIAGHNYLFRKFLPISNR